MTKLFARVGGAFLAGMATRAAARAVIAALPNHDPCPDVPWLMYAGCSKVDRSLVTVRLRAVAPVRAGRLPAGAGVSAAWNLAACPEAAP